MNNTFGIAVKCLTVYNGEILLLSKTEDEMRSDASVSNWDIPGGRVKFGESVDSAVIRELKEEIGISPKQVILKGTSTIIRPDSLHLLIVLFKCICPNNNVKLSDEHNYYSWKHPNEIFEDNSIPTWIKDLVMKCSE